MNARKKISAPVETLIHVTRGQKVMLDSDLADLYEVPTGALNQASRRNIERFPQDFMFQLLPKEVESLRSQFVISKVGGHGGRRYMPYAYTEHGVVMSASVLNSRQAIQMSLLIVRAFVRMRGLMATNKDLAVRLEKIEHGHERTDSIIEVLIEDIGKLSRDIHWIKNPPLKPKHRIGFFVEKKSDV